MGRMKKGKCWRVRFYDNRAREGKPLQDYLCKSIIEITNKTGMGRGHIFQIKDNRIARCNYHIDIVDIPIIEENNIEKKKEDPIIIIN